MKKRKKTEFQRFWSMLAKLDYQIAKDKAEASKRKAEEKKGDKS